MDQGSQANWGGSSGRVKKLELCEMKGSGWQWYRGVTVKRQEAAAYKNTAYHVIVMSQR